MNKNHSSFWCPSAQRLRLMNIKQILILENISSLLDAGTHQSIDILSNRRKDTIQDYLR